jgi:hypothetical protein
MYGEKVMKEYLPQNKIFDDWDCTICHVCKGENCQKSFDQDQI